MSSEPQIVRVHDETTYRATRNSYAAKGFTTIESTPTSITLSRKKPFNWILAIICLFIPIIGWIALGAMLFAYSRGTQVVEIILDSSAARSA